MGDKNKKMQSVVVALFGVVAVTALAGVYLLTSDPVINVVARLENGVNVTRIHQLVGQTCARIGG